MSEQDSLRRFLFEGAPLRGHWVRLSRAWIEAREHQRLPPGAMGLLGEALAAATLLSSTLKVDGTLTLQLAGSTGQVAMLVAQATAGHTVRGVAQLAAAPAAVADAAGSLRTLVEGGRLVVSLAQGDGHTPWQGIVPLAGDDLAGCLESYFAVSEQLPTAIVLAADACHAAGLLLQKLPDAGRGGIAGAVADDLWEEATALLGTLGRDELLAVEPAQLLQRLFGGHDLRLFDAEAVRFACRCSRERVAAMLQGLGEQEIKAILAEQGAVEVICEFCCRPYRFDAVDAGQLFAPPGGASSTRLN